jgi:hypothetical protein
MCLFYLAAFKIFFFSLSQKNWAGGVAQGEGPEFKPQYCKINK